MFKKRSTKKELIDIQKIEKIELLKNLKEFEIINRWLGCKRSLIKSLDYIYHKNNIFFKNEKITIADLGCGGGDLLKEIHYWATDKNIKPKLVGIEKNPDIIQYAKESNQALSTIQYKNMDILAEGFNENQFDVICLNNVCHHFDNEPLKKLLESLVKQTRLAIIINDLHRHFIAYFSIKIITKVLGLSFLARHDGPLSVLRAFRKKELLEVMPQLDVMSVQVKWCWPFRWLVIIECMNFKRAEEALP